MHLPPAAQQDTSFQAFILHLLAHEGGFVNDPADPGGATNWGISLRWLRTQGLLGDVNQDGVVDERDVRELSADQAAAIYYQHWWTGGGYYTLPWPVSAKLCDMAVNMGHAQAVRLAQRACVDLGRDPGPVDGILGARTRTAIQYADAEALTVALCRHQELFYRRLADRRPPLAKFLRGWLRRANWKPQPLSEVSVP